MRVAACWKVHRRNEIVLDELCQSCYFLILLLHNLDMLCELKKSHYNLQLYIKVSVYLNNALTIRLETKLSNDRELYLSAEREHGLLIPDHAITGLLLCQTDSR